MMFAQTETIKKCYQEYLKFTRIDFSKS